MVHVHQPQLCPNAPASRGSEVLPSTRMNPNPQTLRTQDGQDIGTENNIATVKQKLTRTAKMMVVMMTKIVSITIIIITTNTTVITIINIVIVNGINIIRARSLKRGSI